MLLLCAAGLRVHAGGPMARLPGSVTDEEPASNSTTGPAWALPGALLVLRHGEGEAAGSCRRGDQPQEHAGDQQREDQATSHAHPPKATSRRREPTTPRRRPVAGNRRGSSQFGRCMDAAPWSYASLTRRLSERLVFWWSGSEPNLTDKGRSGRQRTCDRTGTEATREDWPTFVHT